MTAIFHLNRRLAAICLCAALTACAGSAHLDAETSRKLYQQGHQAAQAGNYAAAIDTFKRLDGNAAAPAMSAQAEAELTYSYYKQGNYAAAGQAANKFIQRYPDHPRADYVHYLRAAASMQAALHLYETGSAQRAPALEESFGYFQEFSQRFPASELNESALRSLMFIRQQLALTHLEEAKADLRSGDVKAGLAKARRVGEEFRGTPAAQEALALIDGPATLQAPSSTTTAAGAAPAAAAPAVNAIASKIPIHDPEWILQQDPGRYTVELIPAASEEAVRKFVDSHNIHGSALYPTADDQARNTLIHGLYPDADSARKAAAQLIKRWGLRQAQVRRLAEVQSTLTTEPALSPPRP